jgi:ABC-type transport system substrate-binding protein
MTRPSGRLPRFATLFAGVVLVAAACTPAASTAPSQAPSTQTATQGTASGEPFAGTKFPATAIDCNNRPEGGKNKDGTPSHYTGQISQIVAVDRLTVEFHLCAPDVSFLSKLAFSSSSIQDTEWLKAHAPDKSYVRNTNGTGPYMVKEWVEGDHVTLEANPNYWGEAPKAKTVVVRWRKEATSRLQDLQAGGAGGVDGIDNVGTEDFATVQADPNLVLKEREALNILYLGFNVDQAPWNNEKVRQAIGIGIDRARIADNFYPAGSEAAKFFTPCAIPAACGGTEWPALDKAKAKQMLTDAGFDFSKEYDFHYRTKSRSYLPSPTEVATDIQSQFKDNLGIKIKLVVEKDDTYLSDASLGKFPLFLLGWGADYPDVTDFLDIFFGTGADKGFGTHFKDIEDLLSQGALKADVATREGIYGKVNDLLVQHAPMVPLVHGGSATAWKKDVEGAHSSPIGTEIFAVMKPGDRQQLVWMQNSEPSGLYCGDESDGDALRICEQIFDALYTYETGGLKTIPALATSCDPSTDGTVYTCHLRDGVKFAKSGTLDANDVVLSFQVQIDAGDPLHTGNLPGNWYNVYLFGGCLNAQPATCEPIKPPASPAPS